MKKAIITIFVLAVLGYGYYYIRNRGLQLQIFQGKTALVGRGDLTIPISATGEIQAKSRSEIKPEASGKVMAIPFEPGALVKLGDLLIKLDPEEEQRSVTRAENDVARARALLKQRQLQLAERRTSSLSQIDARIKSSDAQLVNAKFRLDKTKRLVKQGHDPQDALVTTQSRYDQLDAQSNGLMADRRQAEIAIELAEQDVILAEKSLESTLTALGDAQKRLRETKIAAPINGMITRIAVEVGEVVQGGRTTITGGTVVAVVADISDIYVRTEVSDADIGAVLWLAPDEAVPGGAELAAEIQASDVPLNVDTSGLLAEKLNAEGTPVKIRVDSFRDEEFEGVIERIYPEPRKAQNIVTYLVNIRVTSPNCRKLILVQGMQADVEFIAQAVSDVILVPHDAIREGPNSRLGVYVPEKVEGERNEHPRFITCRFGLDNGLYAELIEGEGIIEGTRVYTELPPEFGDKDEDED